MKVQEVMTKEAHCCRASDSLQKAAHLMWARDVGALPVIDENGKPIAMITDRDIAMHAAIKGRPLSDLRVSGCMSGTLWSCKPGDTVAAAEKVMREHQVHRLPVLSGSELQGVVTLHDIARAVGERKDDSLAVAKTYGAIARPRSTQLAAG